MKANEVFGRLRALVDEACESCSFRIAIDGAAALGMSGGRTGGPYSLDYDYAFADDAGGKVELSFHSYDQSKAYSVRPDMNKFTVTLAGSETGTTTHHNQYEG